MAIRSIAQIKEWFKRGAYPTAEQFSDWLDSFWHKTENLALAEDLTNHAAENDTAFNSVNAAIKALGDAAAELKMSIGDHSYLTDAEFRADGETAVSAKLNVYNAVTKITATLSKMLPVATGENAGMMPAPAYALLLNLAERVNAMAAGVGGKEYGPFLSKAALDAFVFPDDATERDRGTVLDDETQGDHRTEYIVRITDGVKRWVFNGITAYDPVGLATLDKPGLGLGSTLDGQMFPEANGTWSLNGYDRMMSDIGLLQEYSESFMSTLYYSALLGITPAPDSESGSPGQMYTYNGRDWPLYSLYNHSHPHAPLKTLGGRTLRGAGDIPLKTIGGQSLFGEGDIPIAAAGGGSMKRTVTPTVALTADLILIYEDDMISLHMSSGSLSLVNKNIPAEVTYIIVSGMSPTTLRGAFVKPAIGGSVELWARSQARADVYIELAPVPSSTAPLPPAAVYRLQTWSRSAISNPTVTSPVTVVVDKIESAEGGGGGSAGGGPYVFDAVAKGIAMTTAADGTNPVNTDGWIDLLAAYGYTPASLANEIYGKGFPGLLLTYNDARVTQYTVFFGRTYRHFPDEQDDHTITLIADSPVRREMLYLGLKDDPAATASIGCYTVPRRIALPDLSVGTNMRGGRLIVEGGIMDGDVPVGWFTTESSDSINMDIGNMGGFPAIIPTAVLPEVTMRLTSSDGVAMSEFPIPDDDDYIVIWNSLERYARTVWHWDWGKVYFEPKGVV